MGLFLNKLKEGKTLIIVPDNRCPEWVYHVKFNGKFIATELHLDYEVDLLSEQEIKSEIELMNLINDSYYYFED